MSARLLRLSGLVSATVLLLLSAAVPTSQADEGYRAITGSGSTWSANMVEQWTADIKQYGISVSFSATGSSAGRREFTAGTVDFAVSEIPYGLTDAQGGTESPPSRGFAYLPIVAGGTSFMYNLKVAGKQVTNLRLSGENLAKIFTGAITSWDDPALKADNPKVALPSRRVVPVVRSDGSGTTAQFTTWMAKEHPTQWDAYCKQQGINYSGPHCPFTSNYPAGPGMVSQSGSLGVSGYVSSPTAEGAINYVEYSYALRAKFPVVKLLNSKGYFVEPTAQAVAVGLLAAEINTDKSNRNSYLTQVLDGVYRSPDARAYPLSSYSYMVIPTAEGGTFKADKGRSLGDFLYYSVCEGQQAAEVLGYSPLPQNLVKAGLEQIRQIPGVQVTNVSLDKCNNPTFSKDGTNTLAKTAPQPPACDAQGPNQCDTATGGAAPRTRNSSAGGATTGSTGGTTGGTTGRSGGSSGSTGGSGGGAAGGTTGAAPSAGTTGGVVTSSSGVAGSTTGVVVDGSGDVVTAGGTVDASAVTGTAFAAPSDTGTALQSWFMALAALSLLGATLGPPLLRQRLDSSA